MSRPESCSTSLTSKSEAGLEAWKNPLPIYRPAPFFALNEDLSLPESRERIQTMLEQFRNLGYGGAYLHPRVGMITEYKSEAWFDAIAFCVKEAERLGLKIYLYDENSYPSGFAGGHVPASCPNSKVWYVAHEILESLPDAINHFSTTLDASDLFLSAYHVEDIEPLHLGAMLTPDELAAWTQDQHISIKGTKRPEGRILAFYLREMKSSPWHGDFPYVSLADPLATKAFIEHTHEAYFSRLGEHFGTLIPSIFTDEACLHTLEGCSCRGTLHLTPYILSQFLDRNQYDLRDHLAELFFDIGDFARVRFDYYETLHVLWFKNWALPLENWCEKHHIALTGHYLEHDWPVPYSTPGHVHLLAHMDWPGTDLLLANSLTGEPAQWLSLQNRAKPGKEPHLALLVHQCASVARQLNKEKVLCEAWGAGGHASTPADYKRVGDWLIALGVNHLVPHHSFMTIRGSRKTDHPQFFSDQSSWYLHLRPLNDHFTRLCQAMSQGTDSRSILVIDPLTSGYLSATRSKTRRETHGAICNGFSNFIQSLADRFLSFDLGDEYVMDEFGIVEEAGLRIGSQCYSAIILPAEITNLRSATLRILEAYLERGGKIWTLLSATPRIDGRVSDAWEILSARFAMRIHRADPQETISSLEWLFPPSLRIRHPEELQGFAHMRRQQQDGGEIHLLVHSGDDEGTVSVSLKAQGVTILDSLTGEEKFPAVKPEAGGFLSFVWPVKGPQSLLVRAEAKPTVSTPLPIPRTTTGNAIPLRLKSIQPQSENRLVLDFCDLQLPGRAIIRGIRALMAQKKIFRHHGFLRNPWHRAIQYRTQILDRNCFGENSGFKATFAFEVLHEAEIKEMRAAIETPEFCQIYLNGQHLDPSTARKSEIDPWIHEFPVAQWLRPGKNELVLSFSPFDVRAELDNVYLVGDFSVQSASTGFVIGQPVRPGYGSWKLQGFPFYDRSMLYRFEIPDVPADCAEFMLEMKADASLVNVLADGKFIAQWGLTRDPLILPKEAVEKGKELTLEVIGTPHNLFGAFHDPHPKPGIMGNQFVGPQNGPVPGSSYDLKNCGLMACPSLRPIISAESCRAPQS